MDGQINIRLSLLELNEYKKACNDKQISISKRLRKFIELDSKFLNENKNIFDNIK